MRLTQLEIPYLSLDQGMTWNNFGLWPCSWIACPDVGKAPFVTAFRRKFHLDQKVLMRVHVSADERYELYLDGTLIGRGPERGDRDHWFFETYELSLESGDHLAAARVWSLGASAPFAQITVQAGFILSPDNEKDAEILGTGTSDWEALVLPGFSFSSTVIPHFTSVGDNLTLDGRVYPWGFEKGEGVGWQPAVVLDRGANSALHTFERAAHLMQPAMLPEMIYTSRQVGKVRAVMHPDGPVTRSEPVISQVENSPEKDLWQDWLDGLNSITLSPGERIRVVIDLEEYYCAYPRLSVSGGKNGQVRLFWSESLYLDDEAREKGNRNIVEDKYFIGKGDTFILDGSNDRCYETLWWQAGRYVELYAEAGESPLVFQRLDLIETRYPLEMKAQIDSSDVRFNRLAPIAIRSLQMCSHETYMDCPYYEQLMYVGDTRLEVLTTFQISHDDRLPVKALKMFDFSRQSTGLTTSRYPSRERQIIPPFSLWWVGMVYDHALWRGNLEIIRELMPCVRGVLDAFWGFRDSEGLVRGPRGWNFVDWVPGWAWGVPPDGDLGVNAIINWQFVWILRQAAELEAWLGEPELAARNLRMASEVARCAQLAFWDESRGLFADDLSHTHYSEHAQCLALLSGELDEKTAQMTAANLFSAPDLARTTIYFTHYLFETCRKMGRIDVLEERLKMWYEHEMLGMRTTLESPEPSRSDCHAWGAHPIYHYFATIMGIRPSRMGYRSVRIAPQLGSLTYVRGEVVHPAGIIHAEFNVNRKGLEGVIELPEGIEGILEWGSQKFNLSSGRQNFNILF